MAFKTLRIRPTIIVNWMEVRMKRRNFEAELVDYLSSEFFDGNLGELARRTGYSKQQIESWVRGVTKPHKATMRWMLSSTIAPEFSVAAEFAPIDIQSVAQISKQLRAVLGTHKDGAGVYSFYDSMCNVLYVGKASSSFLKEMYQQLRAPLGIPFPRAVSRAPSKRWNVVKYVSAYEVPAVDHLDYPKHVESLVLRLSKPIGNRVLGHLKRSSPPREK
jgi:hypothetical protein